MYDKKGKWIEPEDSIKNKLLSIGITVDTSRQKGQSYMLIENGVDIGYYNARQALELLNTKT